MPPLQTAVNALSEASQEFRQAIDQKTTKLSSLFCIEYKFATATSYERMEAGLALFYRQTGIQHPAIDTIRKEMKAIKNELPQVRGVPGEEEGSVGAEVDLTLLLESVLKLPIATEMTKFFDEEETVLLRVTIDNAKETAQRCMELTTVNLVNFIDETGIPPPFPHFPDVSRLLSCFLFSIDNPEACFTASIWEGAETKSLLEKNLTHFQAGLKALVQEGINVTRDGATKKHPCKAILVCDLSALIKLLSMTNWNSTWCCFKCFTQKYGKSPSHMLSCKTDFPRPLVQREWTSPRMPGTARWRTSSSKENGMRGNFPRP